MQAFSSFWLQSSVPHQYLPQCSINTTNQIEQREQPRKKAYCVACVVLFVNWLLRRNCSRSIDAPSASTLRKKERKSEAVKKWCLLHLPRSRPATAALNQRTRLLIPVPNRWCRASVGGWSTSIFVRDQAQRQHRELLAPAISPRLAVLHLPAIKLLLSRRESRRGE